MKHGEKKNQQNQRRQLRDGRLHVEALAGSKSRKDLAFTSVSKLAYVNVYTHAFVCLILERKCTVNYTIREIFGIPVSFDRRTRDIANKQRVRSHRDVRHATSM